jgi:hypothetical protein
MVVKSKEPRFSFFSFLVKAANACIQQNTVHLHALSSRYLHISQEEDKGSVCEEQLLTDVILRLVMVPALRWSHVEILRVVDRLLKETCVCVLYLSQREGEAVESGEDTVYLFRVKLSFLAGGDGHKRSC